jgi:hypothetical protein
MKTTMTKPLLSNTTMTGTLAHMLDRMADAIGAQTMGIIAGLMWESIAESITTGTQRLGIIMVRLTMAHLGIIGSLTMESLGIIMVRPTNGAFRDRGVNLETEAGSSISSFASRALPSSADQRLVRGTFSHAIASARLTGGTTC